MSQSENHFLDSKTLIALLFLAVSWLAWDYYMKKKYPDHFKAKTATEKSEPDRPSKIEAIGPLKSSFKKTPALKGPKEKLFLFKGENLELVFSSHGFGIKKAKIKAYKDRQNQIVEFEDPKSPLFSLYAPELYKQALPFKIQKTSDFEWTGFFSSPSLSVKKTVEVDDKNWILKVKTEIQPKTQLSSLDLFFSHSLPPESQDLGLFKVFFIYGMDVLKSFIFYNSKQIQRPKDKNLCENFSSCESYPNTQILAIGDKYFGKAFLNRSDILPSSSLHKEGRRAYGQIRYQLLHSKKQEIKYQIFLGPKSLKNLEGATENLRSWLDFGFFSWLARPILLLLVWLHKFFGNWGLAVIFLTLLIRLILLPINIKSYQSMKKMKDLQPEINEIKKSHKSDPKKMNQEVMALMKKHKANPLSGCLPMFIQFPVFFALYRVLGESIELYQSPFFFWIKDMSLKDPYYIFPVLSGLVMFIQQSLTPMNLPKEQARLIKILPLIFLVFMLSLPSGLTIYIFFSGLFGLVQQAFFVKIRGK